MYSATMKIFNNLTSRWRTPFCIPVRQFCWLCVTATFVFLWKVSSLFFTFEKQFYYVYCACFIKINILCAVEKIHQLRTLVAIGEKPGSYPLTDMVVHKYWSLQYQGIWHSLLMSMNITYVSAEHTYI